MEEYADYIDENGMITIKWWVIDDGEPIAATDYDADAAMS